MGIVENDAFGRVLEALRESGFLLESDPNLPSICVLVTGERPRGSWWSHPMAHTIFAVNERLARHPDVLVTKLVSGKVTFVERRLWPNLVAIGSSRSRWQMARLSESAKALLARVDASDYLRTDQIVWPETLQAKPGDATRELEKKVLAVTTQIHTETGKHAKQIESWQRWAARHQLPRPNPSVEEAMTYFMQRLVKLNADFSGRARLPWA